MKRFILVIISLLIFPQFALASFSYSDYWSAGDNLILHDSHSGLDWLSTKVTINQSYNSVANSSLYGEWRHATVDEFYNLLLGNTQSPVTEHLTNQTNMYFYNNDAFVIRELTNHNMTQILASYGFYIGSGFLQSTSSDVYTANLTTNFSYFDMASIALNTCTIDLTDPTVGHFLVRGTTATPIPGAFWLLGTGLMGLAGLRRKIRN